MRIASTVRELQLCDVLNSGDVGGDSGNPKVVERRGELRGESHEKGGTVVKRPVPLSSYHRLYIRYGLYI